MTENDKPVGGEKMVPLMPLCLYLADAADPPIEWGETYEDRVVAWQEIIETFLEDLKKDV